MVRWEEYLWLICPKPPESDWHVSENMDICLCNGPFGLEFNHGIKVSPEETYCGWHIVSLL